jgi:hypothetical protein
VQVTRRGYRTAAQAGRARRDLPGRTDAGLVRRSSRLLTVDELMDLYLDGTLCHAFIPAALDAGVPLRHVQEAGSHADPRTTMRDDRTWTPLDWHAAYIVSAFLAGAGR